MIMKYKYKGYKSGHWDWGSTFFKRTNMHTIGQTAHESAYK